MLKLKDRNKSIPGGYSFYLPELKWKAPGNFPSFSVVCSALQAAVTANPFLASKHNWPADRDGIENWVDTYNATVCAKMGWEAYILTGSGGGSVPKSQPPPHSLASLAAAAARARDLVAGAKTLISWLDSGEPPADRDLATARAAACAACPHNDPHDLTAWFTLPASELIKRQVQKIADRSISTVHDEHLHVCDICYCPLKLKVQTPMKWILKEIAPKKLAELKAVPRCWVGKEA
jgi:hypothetical protein